MTPIVFEGYAVPTDFVSDGCTYAPDKWPKIKLTRPFFSWINLTPACVLHDFQRRHGPDLGISVGEADRRMRRFLKYLGAGWIAQVYYFVVKQTRFHYRNTLSLPERWRIFLKRTD